jgi:hypothetical protein
MDTKLTSLSPAIVKVPNNDNNEFIVNGEHLGEPTLTLHVSEHEDGDAIAGITVEPGSVSTNEKQMSAVCVAVNVDGKYFGDDLWVVGEFGPEKHRHRSSTKTIRIVSVNP